MSKINGTTITREQIRALRQRAELAGDNATILLCRAAVDGSPTRLRRARAKIAKIICVVQAMS